MIIVLKPDASEREVDHIIDRLREDVILLSKVIDRDLSHWLGGVPEARPGKEAVSA